MATAIVTEPAQEPISLEEIKTHLRVDGNGDDSELEGLIQEGRRFVEKQTGRVLITQTWNLKLDYFSNEIKIPYPPCQSISSVSYQDTDNASQTLSSAYYVLDTTQEPARMVSAYSYDYPDTYSNPNAVTIKFIAGYGTDPEDVPERYKRAIKLYVQWMFDGDSSVKDALDSIIMQDRITWL